MAGAGGGGGGGGAREVKEVKEGGRLIDLKSFDILIPFLFGYETGVFPSKYTVIQYCDILL